MRYTPGGCFFILQGLMNMAKIGNQGDGGGRPPVVLTPKQIDEVETLSAVLSQEQIADYFGINRNTFHNITKRQPEVYERYKKGKAKAIQKMAGGLIEQATSGNTAAAIFYLKTQAGWKDTTAAEETKQNDVIQKVQIEVINKDAD